MEQRFSAVHFRRASFWADTRFGRAAWSAAVLYKFEVRRSAGPGGTWTVFRSGRSLATFASLKDAIAAARTWDFEELWA